VKQPGIKYDEEADAIYITLNPHGNFRRTTEVSDSVILDIDIDGEVMGIEILSPPPEVVERLRK
jgi:uncharacterized protein YuzE